MLFRRSIRHLMSLPLSAAALAVSASSLFAQGRPLFEWSGRVDREVRITMHGRDARMQIRNSAIDGSVELRVLGDVPERRLRLSRKIAAELGALLVRITETKH